MPTKIRKITYIALCILSVFNIETDTELEVRIPKFYTDGDKEQIKDRLKIGYIA